MTQKTKTTIALLSGLGLVALVILWSKNGFRKPGIKTKTKTIVKKEYKPSFTSQFPLHKGSSGGAVTELQKMLNVKILIDSGNFFSSGKTPKKLVEDGNYGTKTQVALDYFNIKTPITLSEYSKLIS